VPRPVGVNMVLGKWIYRQKYHTDGWYKAHWVIRGFTQQHSVDYSDTFSPITKLATIRIVLSLATSKDCLVNQLDVKTAFLHGNLPKCVYAQQPSGFVSDSHLNFVCKLNKSLYGFKQAPRTWFLRFTAFLAKLGFRGSKSDTSLFLPRHGSSTTYLLLYVDDIILTVSSMQLLQQIITKLKSEFSMSNLGPLQHFLGISMQLTTHGLFLSQEQYASDLLQCANMPNCNPCLTPADTKAKPSLTDGTPLANSTEYRSLAGVLQYLTLRRPDISYDMPFSKPAYSCTLPHNFISHW
jgi:hypothetical protein